jgi:hypothetical protein
MEKIWEKPNGKSHGETLESWMGKIWAGKLRMDFQLFANAVL